MGSLYLLEGIGITAQAFFVPAEFAAIWASVPAETLDAIAVRGMLVAGLPGVLTWVLLGAMMWIFSGAPAKARMLVVVVVAWELLVWAPIDLVGLLQWLRSRQSRGADRDPRRDRHLGNTRAAARAKRQRSRAGRARTLAADERPARFAHAELAHDGRVELQRAGAWIGAVRPLAHGHAIAAPRSRSRLASVSV